MIRIESLGVALGGFMLQDINLEIDEGEYFIILGPTGAGKTVLLEAIAGLHPIAKGQIWSGEREVTKLSPEKRGIGFVYQDQQLFPHLSVKDNIAFGLKMAKRPKEEMEARIAAMAELHGIEHLLERSPENLSGGERQKVALARALITEPEILLLDEPLSAVDLETREQMQRDLQRIQRRLKVTTIHVTHDFEEAVALGQRVAILNQGRIAQVGTPEEVLRQPSSEFVARFALSRNVFSGEASDSETGSATIAIGQTRLMAATELRGQVRLSLRPEDILISREPLKSTARNSLQGVVSDIADRGAVIYVTVTVPPDFICLITRQAFQELELSRGARVWLTFKASAIHVF